VRTRRRERPATQFQGGEIKGIVLTLITYEVTETHEHALTSDRDCEQVLDILDTDQLDEAVIALIRGLLPHPEKIHIERRV
jgi:hypothetical protein